MHEIDLDGILAGRASIYEYFFLAYYKPFSKELLDYTPAFIETIAQLAESTGDQHLQNATEKLQQFKTLAATIDEQELILKLNACYSKLYITGSSIKMTENSFRDTELNKQKILMNIIDFFANNNIMKPVEVNLPSDALAVELYFMFRMADKLAKTDDDLTAAKQQLSFLQDHLAAWFGTFATATAERYADGTLAVFYCALAEACRGFLEYDVHLLKIVCESTVEFNV